MNIDESRSSNRAQFGCYRSSRPGLKQFLRIWCEFWYVSAPIQNTDNPDLLDAPHTEKGELK
jgi:hypothetical protein